jgi:hypothetical protein
VEGPDRKIPTGWPFTCPIATELPTSTIFAASLTLKERRPFGSFFTKVDASAEIGTIDRAAIPQMPDKSARRESSVIILLLELV